MATEVQKAIASILGDVLEDFNNTVIQKKPNQDMLMWGPNKQMRSDDALFLLLLGQYSNMRTSHQWEWATETFWQSSPQYFKLLLTTVQ